MSAGVAVATAGPRRERSGKARTAGGSGLACGPEGRLEDVWKVLTPELPVHVCPSRPMLDTRVPLMPNMITICFVISCVVAAALDRKAGIGTEGNVDHGTAVLGRHGGSWLATQ